MTAVRLTDSTLRDGSHSVAHRFSPDDVRAIAGGLATAHVPVIEVAHGDGLAGSSFNYGFSTHDERDLIAAAVEVAGDAVVAVLILPGIGTIDDLHAAHAIGARLVRVATHCTEADIADQHLSTARELGFEANGFLMMSHMVEPHELAPQALRMESAGAQVVYVVDSAGALVPDAARDRVLALRDALGPATAVGFHAHDNLGCGVANTLAAVAAGATRVDGSLAGLGAGAGNMATELFACLAERSGLQTGLDARRLIDVAEDVVRPRTRVEARRDRSAALIGYAGVYSSFLLHAERAARRFDVPVADILVTLGERRVVGGQEDMIIDVAAALAGRRDLMGEPA